MKQRIFLTVLALLLFVFPLSVSAQQIQQSTIIAGTHLFFNYDENNDGKADDSYKIPILFNMDAHSGTGTYYVDKNRQAFADAAATMRVYPATDATSANKTVILKNSWGIAVDVSNAALHTILPQINENASWPADIRFSKETLTDPKSYEIQIDLGEIVFAVQDANAGDITQVPCSFKSAIVPFSAAATGVTTIFISDPARPEQCYDALFTSLPPKFNFNDIHLRINGKNAKGETVTSGNFCKRDSNYRLGSCTSMERELWGLNGDDVKRIYKNDFSFEENKLGFELKTEKASNVVAVSCALDETPDLKALYVSDLQLQGFPIRMTFNGKTVYKSEDFYANIIRPGRKADSGPKTFYLKESGDIYFIATNDREDSYTHITSYTFPSEKEKYLFNIDGANEIQKNDRFEISMISVSAGERKFEIFQEPDPTPQNGQLNIPSADSMCQGVIKVDNLGNMTVDTTQTAPATPTPQPPITQRTSILMCESIKCDGKNMSPEQKQKCYEAQTACRKCAGTDAAEALNKQAIQLENEIANMPNSPVNAAIIAQKQKTLAELKVQLAQVQQTHVWTAVGCLSTDFSTFVANIIQVLGGFMGLYILYCIVWNGFKVMTSQGNPETLKKAQEEITGCIVGFLVLMFSVIILRIIGVNILGLPFLQ